MNTTAPAGRQHSKSFTTSNAKPGTSSTANPAKRLEKSYEELIEEKQLSNVEKQRLTAVYEFIVNVQMDKNPGNKNKEPSFGITVQHLMEVLAKLDYPISRQEADILIWEVDENQDGCIDEREFELMYKRCIFDATLMEPRSLFNILQFLMFDKAHKGKITVEDTLELLFVRHGRYRLDDEIYAIFGAEEKTVDGQEKSITFPEFYERMKKKDFKKRKELEVERKTIKLPALEETK